jgi:hypothetical protein
VLWEIDAELSGIAAARGDATEAAALQAEAAAVISDIAATIDEQGLRSSFLSLPKVRAVLDSA